MEFPLVEPGMEAWVEYGFAGLVAFVFLVVVGFLLWENRAARKDLTALTVRSVEATTTMAANAGNVAAVLGVLKESVADNGTKIEDLTKYVKLRDQFIDSHGRKR